MPANPSPDQRLLAVLKDPRAYFAAARSRAQAIAAAEVHVELAARAYQRRHGDRDLSRSDVRR